MSTIEALGNNTIIIEGVNHVDVDGFTIETSQRSECSICKSRQNIYRVSTDPYLYDDEVPDELCSYICNQCHWECNEYASSFIKVGMTWRNRDFKYYYSKKYHELKELANELND